MNRHPYRFFPVFAFPSLVAAGALALGAAQVRAQAQEEPRRSVASIMLEEVVVTARKREERVQEVPLSITAYSADQIDVLKVRDLTNLSVGMPNVSLEDIGTTRGTANFSIRGLGINSSIPSIDPTVGVFLDGVYLGLNNGIVFDLFDLESVEVLRGPQGTLFGRNVIGGAVLLNTKKPGDSPRGSARFAVDTGEDGGLNRYYMGAVGGPVTDGFGARLVVYYNDDEGKFENNFTGDDFGEIEQTMIRATGVWSAGGATELVLRYEYNDTDGEGPAAQSHTSGAGIPGSPLNNDRDSFDFSIDEEGFQETETHFFTAELDWDVKFGDGAITNIFGYRDYRSHSRSDVDGQPVWLFHAPAWLEAEQISNELRYNGIFADRANVTAGLYYFDNRIDYHERRDLLGSLAGGVAPLATQDGGGEYEVETMAAFAAVDYELADRWTLTARLRYTSEEKAARIASLNRNFNAPCNIVEGPACPIDFVDDEDWNSWSPKLGATYHFNDRRRLYAHWTRGFRSGGYNLRNTDPNEDPGPFDEEQVDNYEIGYKSTNDWGRLNAAVFYNEIDEMQREVNLPSVTSGVIQLIQNTADATIFGVEMDGVFRLTENLLLLASVGYIDAEYDSVTEDLNNDGVIDDIDKGLDLPRAPEWTYSLGFSHDVDIGEWGYLTSRVNYAYRDDFAFTDSNLGFIEEVEMVDAGLDFYSGDGRWVFSLYARNLLDEVSFGGDTQLPATLVVAPLGGTFSPLTPGRRYGAELTYNFF